MVQRWKLGLLGGATAASAVSCAVVAGLGDYQTGVGATFDGSFGDDASEEASIDAGIDVPQLPSCGAGYVCYGPVPGWEGPFQISEVAIAAEAGPPECPETGPYRDRGVLTDLLVPDASCPCTCTTQVTCSATVTLSDNGGCSGNCLDKLVTSPGCVPVTCALDNVWAGATVAPTTCTATTLSDIPDAGFGTSAYSCSAVMVDSGACEAGTSCSATPGQGFEPGLCVRKQGDSPCPGASPYAVRRVYYAGIVDERTCAGCGCNVTEVASCNYNFGLYAEAGCNRGGLGSIAVSAGSCQHSTGALNAPPRSAFVGLSQPDGGGACSAEGGTLAGEAGPDPTDAVTFCCTQ
jgi:hypothetical protein